MKNGFSSKFFNITSVVTGKANSVTQPCKKQLQQCTNILSVKLNLL